MQRRAITFDFSILNAPDEHRTAPVHAGAWYTVQRHHLTWYASNHEALRSATPALTRIRAPACLPF